MDKQLQDCSYTRLSEQLPESTKRKNFDKLETFGASDNIDNIEVNAKLKCTHIIMASVFLCSCS